MGHQEPDSEHQPANSGAGPFSPGRKKVEDAEGYRDVNPQKEGGRKGEAVHGNLSQADCGFRQGRSHSKSRT